MSLKEKAKQIKKEIPVIFLALSDPRTPVLAKIMAAITVGYALSPIDLIPDFIPVFGYLDDLIILPVFIVITIKLIPEEVIELNRQKAKEIWKDGKPKKWFYGIPIIMIWIVVLILIIQIIK